MPYGIESQRVTLAELDEPKLWVELLPADLLSSKHLETFFHLSKLQDVGGDNQDVAVVEDALGQISGLLDELIIDCNLVDAKGRKIPSPKSEDWDVSLIPQLVVQFIMNKVTDKAEVSEGLKGSSEGS